MFHVHHYDPRKEDRENNKNRRRRDRTTTTTTLTSLTVVPKKDDDEEDVSEGRKDKNKKRASPSNNNNNNNNNNNKDTTVATTNDHQSRGVSVSNSNNRSKGKKRLRIQDVKDEEHHNGNGSNNRKGDNQERAAALTEEGGITTLPRGDCIPLSGRQEKKSQSHLEAVPPMMSTTTTTTTTTTKTTLQVIAPETDGVPPSSPSKRNPTGRSSSKGNNKLSIEAFDDLDLPDESWLLGDGGDETINDRMEEDGTTTTTTVTSLDPTDEIQRALYMSELPIVDAAKRWGLADFLVRNLQREGHSHFFPIQALVIPDVIVAEKYMGTLQTKDICCAAPTGSGKTLAFVLPVLNALSPSSTSSSSMSSMASNPMYSHHLHHRVRRLRALVILPSRDLAKQVHSVFDKYSEGSNLKIGLAIGQTDFHAEQKELILGSQHERQQDHNPRYDDANTSSNSTITGGGGNIATHNHRCQYIQRQQHWAQLRHSMDPGNLSLALDAMRESLEYGAPDSATITTYGPNNNNINKSIIPLGGISAVDVLVCTPGRLVDHLDNTPGFTLQHLRWLVIDEADRLLSQSYHGWIQRVLDSIHVPQLPIIDPNNIESWKHIDPVTYRRTAQDSLSNVGGPSTTANESGESASSLLCQRIQLRKLLYSATLTKDPQKLSSLRLVNPKFFNANDLRRRDHATTTASCSTTTTKRPTGRRDLEGSLYSIPEQLKEYTVECTAEQKPLVLLALLLERLQQDNGILSTSTLSVSSAATNPMMTKKATKKKKNMIVVFTSSLESTHRLTRLLQLLWQTSKYGVPPMEYSSALGQSQRSQLMERCNDPNDHSIQVLVCSDGMSRGMDLASVSAVIHYDVPGMAKTYVHRCGRTARAGQEGHAIALLKGTGQVGQFNRLRRLIARPEVVQAIGVKTALVRDILPIYKECVSRRLKLVLDAESKGELKPTDTDLTRWLPGQDEEMSSETSSESDSGDTTSSSDDDDSS